MNVGKGFTLIELMIVVVILTILALIGTKNFHQMQYRAKEAAVKANGHTCQLAVESYATQTNGFYPPAATAMNDIINNLPGGQVFENPYQGGPGLTIGAGPTEGMCDYLDPAAVGQPNQYHVDCYGTGAIVVLSLSNG